LLLLAAAPVFFGCSAGSGSRAPGSNSGDSTESGGTGGGNAAAGTGGMSGGTASSSGGAPAGGGSGGDSSAGSSTGGAGVGGASSGGSGGNAVDPSAEPSAGCGTPTSLTLGEIAEAEFASGVEYDIGIPADYDPNVPKPVIFAYHGSGGNAQYNWWWFKDVYVYLSVKQPIWIFVEKEGGNWGPGDLNGTKTIVEQIKADYCVDLKRFYTTGFSAGGCMSGYVGCAMSDVFAAAAPQAGCLMPGWVDCSEPVALMTVAGTADTAQPISGSTAIVNKYKPANGCSDAEVDGPAAIDNGTCVNYECSGAPTAFCSIPGRDHHPEGTEMVGIAAFFDGISKP
jgi:polyhydroxybutyrate depolymerase